MALLHCPFADWSNTLGPFPGDVAPVDTEMLYEIPPKSELVRPIRWCRPSVHVSEWLVPGLLVEFLETGEQREVNPRILREIHPLKFLALQIENEEQDD